MIYKEKCSFDDKNWYQLEWSDIPFREFDEIIKQCKDIEELKNKVPDLKAYGITKCPRRKKYNRK